MNKEQELKNTIIETYQDLDYCNLLDKLNTYTPMNDTDIKFDTETKTTLEKEKEMSMIKAFKEMKL